MSEKLYEKILAKKVDGFVATAGIVCNEVREGHAEGEIVIKKEHLNPIGTVHGGSYIYLGRYYRRTCCDFKRW